MIDGRIPDATENPRGFGGREDPEPEMNEDGLEQPTEEEQMDYDLLVVRAQKIMFGSGKDKILTLMGTEERPSKAIGKAASMLVKSLMESAKQSGREIDAGVALNAGAEIAEDLNELGKKNKVFEYDSPEDERQELEDSLLWGTKFYGDGMIASGEITPEMQQLAQKAQNDGLAEEYRLSAGRKENKVGDAVKQAVSRPGLVNGAMRTG